MRQSQASLMVITHFFTHSRKKPKNQKTPPPLKQCTFQAAQVSNG